MTTSRLPTALRTSVIVACVAMVAGILFACAGGGGYGNGGGRFERGGVQPGPSKPPPTFPVQQDVPIDANLVAAARQEIDALLKSDLATNRAHAIETYRKLMPEEAAGPILSNLDTDNPIVRFAAALAAGDIKLASAKPKLLDHLRDPDPKVRVAVLYALHQIGDKSRSHELEKTATDYSPEGKLVRGATAMVLGRMSEPTVANILRLLAADPDAIVRQQAEEALFLHGDEAGRNAIFAYCNSRQPDDQMFGLLALSEAKEPKYRQNARSELTNEYPEVALVAARAMGEMDADDGYGVAMKAAKSGDWRQASLAAHAFGAIGRSDAQPYLAELLKFKASNPKDDEEERKAADVRAAAANAILRITKHPKKYNRQGDLVR